MYTLRSLLLATLGTALLLPVGCSGGDSGEKAASTPAQVPQSPPPASRGNDNSGEKAVSTPQPVPQLAPSASSSGGSAAATAIAVAFAVVAQSTPPASRTGGNSAGTSAPSYFAQALQIVTGSENQAPQPVPTNVKPRWSQAAQRTVQNIKKDPVGYLTWALEEVGKTESKLQASELSLKTKQNTTHRALEKYTADKSQYEKLLSEFKDAYITASEKKTWPAQVRGMPFDELGLKRKIVECSEKFRNTTALVDTYTKIDKVIGDKADEVEGKLTEVEKLKNKLSTNIEIAKVNQSVDEIGALGDQVQAIIDTSAVVVATAEQGTARRA